MPNGPHYQTPAYREAVRYVRKYGPPCYYCGNKATTVEHLIPVALGGGDDSLAPSCRPCNIKRGARLGNAIMRANKRAREDAQRASRFFVSQTQDPPASQTRSLARYLPNNSANPSRIW